MQLSVSVRIAEGFLSKEVPILKLEQVAAIAQQTGFSAICMRASQLGVQSDPAALADARAVLDAHQLSVSMVTGDFDTVYNNAQGPRALQRIAPYVRLAQQLGAPMIRVALKEPADILAAQAAADIAADAGIQLVHQCHTLSLFETLEGIERTLTAIDRPNFGLIYEPANLELCGQAYGPSAIRRLAPWIFNVYLQNQRVHAEGDVTLDTWCRGPVRFDIIPIHETDGIDFSSVLSGLRSIDYEGSITVHQSAPEGQSPLDSMQSTANYLRRAIGEI